MLDLVGLAKGDHTQHFKGDHLQNNIVVIDISDDNCQKYLYFLRLVSISVVKKHLNI